MTGSTALPEDATEHGNVLRKNAPRLSEEGGRESKQRPLPVNLPILNCFMTHDTSSIHAITLLSGGLDSCVETAEAVATHGRSVGALHVSYGQRTANRELAAFAAIADHYGLTTRLHADAGYLGRMGGSSLVDDHLTIPTSHATSTSADDGSQLPNTYVPFRNTHLLSIAVAWAEVLGAVEIFCGAHAADSAYPDTQPEFFDAFQHLLHSALPAPTEIIVRTPLMSLDKKAIVQRGAELSAPLQLTWSCYAEESTPCGRCHSCHLRQTGFEEAGLRDPLSSTSDLQ